MTLRNTELLIYWHGCQYQQIRWGIHQCEMLELFWNSEFVYPIWPKIWGTGCCFHKNEGLLKVVKYIKMYINDILLIHGLIPSVLEQLWYLQDLDCLKQLFYLCEWLVKWEDICFIIKHKILHCCQLYIIYFFTIYGFPVNIIFFVYSCVCLFP